ncbi:MAG: aromatic acid exporter family protein [Clostridia bacterium]|nr:aromatic acid exporter family protein [Clostridia bacterium]
MIVNSVKMIFAAICSICVAQLFNLDFAISAGIVAILTIQPSKRETFSTAIARFYGFVIAIVISFICFKIFGITTLGFFVYLTIYVFICQKFRWYSAIAMNSVLISHFLSIGVMNFQTIINESLIFLIGVLFGILVNLHLHKNTKEMNRLKNLLTEQVQKIINRMSQRIIDQNLQNYDGKCFIQLNKDFYLAKEIADVNYKNQLKKDDSDIKYLENLGNQIGILYEMYKRVKNIKTQPSTAKIISDFLQKVSLEYPIQNNEILLNEFNSIWQEMKNRPLPQTRQEFEDRAELFTLLELIEEFL